MAEIFYYRAVNEQGEISEGKIETESREEALRSLRSKKQKPIRLIKEETASKEISIKSSKIDLKSIVLFTRQLYTMLDAGMTINKSLDVLVTQTESKKLKKALTEISSDVQKGTQLSASMMKQKDAFPPLLVKMIEAGEATGNLSDVLQRMTIHYEKERKINAKIKGAMIYPIVLTVVSISAVTFMLAVVIPTFVELFSSSGVPLPWPTRVIIAMSEAVGKWWYLFVLGIVFIIIGIKQGLKNLEFKRGIDKFKLNAIMIKEPIRKIVTSRFTRTLSTLIASGIPIIQAMESAAKTTNNLVVEDAIKEVVEGIEKGMSMTELLRKIEIFPKMMVSMVAVGEESGNLEGMLSKIADYYDDELEAALQKLVSMIEPVMIVIMGGAIGFIVVAMFFPMFDMVGTIK